MQRWTGWWDVPPANLPAHWLCDVWRLALLLPPPPAALSCHMCPPCAWMVSLPLLQRKLLPLPIACRPWLTRLVIRTAYVAAVTFFAVSGQLGWMACRLGPRLRAV